MYPSRSVSIASQGILNNRLMDGRLSTQSRVVNSLFEVGLDQPLMARRETRKVPQAALSGQVVVRHPIPGVLKASGLNGQPKVQVAIQLTIREERY